MINKTVFTSLLKVSSAAMVATTLSACIFSNGWRQNNSLLPIETIDNTHGEVASTYAFEAGNKLYVAGSMRKSLGHHMPTATHVDVQLIGKNGRVIAEKRDDIEPAHPHRERGRGGRYSYVASFPLHYARQASKVRVIYHTESHFNR